MRRLKNGKTKKCVGENDDKTTIAIFSCQERIHVYIYGVKIELYPQKY